MFSHGDPSTKKLVSPVMRSICCGRTCTSVSSTAPARLRHFGGTWTRAECGSGQRAEIESEEPRLAHLARPAHFGGGRRATVRVPGRGIDAVRKELRLRRCQASS